MLTTRIAAMTVACLIAQVVLAADPPKVIVLFDGKTLEGWKKAEFFKAADLEVKVLDGAITMPTGSPMSGLTSTRKDLPSLDYELAYEAKRTAGGDFFAAATFPVGDSFVTLVNGGWGGSVTGISNINGSNASENETTKFVKYQNDTWYKFRVRVTGKVLRGWVDDKPVFAVNHEGQQLATRIETRVNQPLGFSTWKSAGAIRSVEIRKLTAAEVEANDKLE